MGQTKKSAVKQPEDLLWPTTPDNATSGPEDTSATAGDLVWPGQLINQQAAAKQDSHWPLSLATFVFIVASLFAFLIGPMQMILLAITHNYEFVTEDYYPAVLKSMLLSSGLFAAVNIVALVLAWHSRPRTARLTAVLCAGASHIFSIGWVAAFLITFAPNHLAITTLIAILVFWTGALLVSKQYSAHEKPTLLMHIILVGLILAASAEAIFTTVYMLQKTKVVEIDELAITELVNSELAARLEGVPENLSKRAYALCNGKYHLVFTSLSDPEAGLFECADNSEVYSINASSSTSVPSAAFLGKVKDTSVEPFFPGHKYLYRDLSAKSLPSELTLLLPASSEADLVDRYLEPIRQILESHEALSLNIFWTDNLEEILTTRDFILVSAVGTLALVDWLPHGDVYPGVEAGKPINYQFEIDHHLIALRDLGADPKLYPAATRDALRTKPHLHYTQTAKPEHLDPDQLRETLLSSFVAPE